LASRASLHARAAAPRRAALHSSSPAQPFFARFKRVTEA
jgi:hypothetical protein